MTGRTLLLRVAATGLSVAVLSGCLTDRPREQPDEVLYDGDYVAARPVAPQGWPAIVWPKENPYSPAKDILGRRLFFDGRLSSSLDRACSWCHGPNAAFADMHGERFSTGVGSGITTRNTPTLANMAFSRRFMLDGSAASLEEQALGPIFAPHEMGADEAVILARLQADTAYVRLFRAAYGEGPVTLEGVVRALATYQRTLISHRSAYDRWQAGDAGALSASAQRGHALFVAPVNACASCHAPPLFTDGGFHNIGLDLASLDPGRAGVTGAAADSGKFKTPTLRNIAATPPYMHDGRFRKLEEVIAHYNAGGHAHPNANARIRPLSLSAQDQADLVAFLEALTDSAFLATRPYLP